MGDHRSISYDSREFGTIDPNYLRQGLLRLPARQDAGVVK